MRRFGSAMALAALLGTAGCADYGYGPGQAIGTVGGGVIGGAIGGQMSDGNGQLIATGAGAVLGALLGGAIGQSVDRSSGY